MNAPLKPSDRAALIARAKRAAVPVVNCVAASIPPARILEWLTDAEKDALVIVLAEAVDWARLRIVIAAEDDGHPDPTPAEMTEAAMLRKAHAEAMRLWRAGVPIPNAVRILDCVYHDSIKAGRAARDAEIPPDPDAERNRLALAEALRETSRTRKAVA